MKVRKKSLGPFEICSADPVQFGWKLVRLPVLFSSIDGVLGIEMLCFLVQKRMETYGQLVCKLDFSKTVAVFRLWYKFHCSYHKHHHELSTLDRLFQEKLNWIIVFKWIIIFWPRSLHGLRNDFFFSSQFTFSNVSFLTGLGILYFFCIWNSKTLFFILFLSMQVFSKVIDCSNCSIAFNL